MSEDHATDAVVDLTDLNWEALEAFDHWGWGVHPAADALPYLPDEELGALAELIRQQGLLVPLIRRRGDGLLVDGRNRGRALALLGVEPIEGEHFVFEGFTDDADVADRVNALNVSGRRQLTKGQKALAAARLLLLGLFVATADDRARTVAAKKWKVSERYIQEAVAIVERGSPELINLVERDEVKNLRLAARLARYLSPRYQQQVIEEGGTFARIKSSAKGVKEASDRLEGLTQLGVGDKVQTRTPVATERSLHPRIYRGTVATLDEPEVGAVEIELVDGALVTVRRDLVRILEVAAQPSTDEAAGKVAHNQGNTPALETLRGCYLVLRERFVRQGVEVLPAGAYIEVEQATREDGQIMLTVETVDDDETPTGHLVEGVPLALFHDSYCTGCREGWTTTDRRWAKDEFCPACTAAGEELEEEGDTNDPITPIAPGTPVKLLVKAAVRSGGHLLPGTLGTIYQWCKVPSLTYTVRAWADGDLRHCLNLPSSALEVVEGEKVPGPYEASDFNDDKFKKPAASPSTTSTAEPTAEQAPPPPPAAPSEAERVVEYTEHGDVPVDDRLHALGRAALLRCAVAALDELAAWEDARRVKRLGTPDDSAYQQDLSVGVHDQLAAAADTLQAAADELALWAENAHSEDVDEATWGQISSTQHRVDALEVAGVLLASAAEAHNAKLTAREQQQGRREQGRQEQDTQASQTDLEDYLQGDDEDPETRWAVGNRVRFVNNYDPGLPDEGALGTIQQLGQKGEQVRVRLDTPFSADGVELSVLWVYLRYLEAVPSSEEVAS